jgi:tricorn protease
VKVNEGDYVLAVNGVPLDPQRDPYASFQALGQKTVVLTVNSSPTLTNAHREVVTCLDDETDLRFKAWIEERRQLVDKSTDGRIGYIYVQSTGTDAQNDLMRQFMAQTQLAKGTDPQLQRAIQEVTARAKSQPKRPAQPPFEKRVPRSDSP